MKVEYRRERARICFERAQERVYAQLGECVCVCMCVRLCVKCHATVSEKERERENERE